MIHVKSHRIKICSRKSAVFDRPILQEVRLVSIPEVAVKRIANPAPLGLRKHYPANLWKAVIAPVDGPVVMESLDDGWPGYEESVIITH